MKFIMIPADSHVYLMVDNATYIWGITNILYKSNSKVIFSQKCT